MVNLKKLLLILSFSGFFSVAVSSLALAAAPACGSRVYGELTLDSDMDCAGTALVFYGNNSTLDCAGHTIKYATGLGVMKTDRDIIAGITIQNCNIVQTGTSSSGYTCAIFSGRKSPGGSPDRILNNTITMNGQGATGICFQNTADDFISGNKITSLNGGGISLEIASDRNSVTNNTISVNKGSGIIVYNSSGSNIFENNFITAIGDGSRGISMSEWSGGNKIKNNTINLSGFDNKGIYFSGYGIANNTVSGNKISVTGMGGSGILMTMYSPSNTVENNEIVTSGDNSYGIHLDTMWDHNQRRVAPVSGSAFKGNKVTTSGRASHAVNMEGYERNYPQLIYNTALVSDEYFDGNILAVNGPESYGFRMVFATNNKMVNNLINAGNPVSVDSYSNTWSVDPVAGPNIVGGPYISGNFYKNPAGTGFSESCFDMDKDGKCDSKLVFNDTNIDYLPLAPAPPIDADKDGVADKDGDLCLNSATDVDPKVNHYSWKGGDLFKTLDPKSNTLVDSGYSITATKGCTCAQIIDKNAGKGGDTKDGCSKATMDKFIQSNNSSGLLQSFFKKMKDLFFFWL